MIDYKTGIRVRRGRYFLDQHLHIINKEVSVMEKIASAMTCEEGVLEFVPMDHFCFLDEDELSVSATLSNTTKCD